MVRILIAEDDAVARRTLEFIFEKAGYEVTVTEDGHSALAALREDDAPTVAIIDIEMPGLDGIEVCRAIREHPPSIPPYLLILTIRGEREEIVRGLESGADDYLTKPFDVDELQARVRVGIRMQELQHNLAARVKELEETLSRVKHLQGLLRGDTHVYEFGPFRLNAAERQLLQQGRPVQITRRLFDLLLLLVQNSGHLVEKEEIMREVWANHIVEENNLTVSISALRAILGETRGRHDYIETLHKHGYRFVAEVRKIR